MSNTQPKPKNPNKYDTPRDWLMFIHHSESKPKTLVEKTQRATNDLTRVEAHACLCMLELVRNGKIDFTVADIKIEAKREIPSSLMQSVRIKGYVKKSHYEKSGGNGKVRDVWILAPGAIAAISEIEKSLNRLIAKASKVLQSKKP